MTTETTPNPAALNNVIRIDDEQIKGHLDRIVRGNGRRTLNALLESEADRLCNAQRYERTEARRDTRAGHYERNLETKAGEVTLKVPKLRRQTFETAIIERYRRREAWVEEALIEMYLAGVSVRRVEDITKALWGTCVSPSTVSDLSKKIYATIETWGNRPITGHIRICIWTALCGSGLGLARCATCLCSWRLASTPKDIARFWVSWREQKKTWQAGRGDPWRVDDLATGRQARRTSDHNQCLEEAGDGEPFHSF